jgi:hypothetical protein
MGWIHCNRRFHVSLALAALALQIVLSFGHVDLPLVSDVSLAAKGHLISLNRAQWQSPTQNPGDHNDYCAICASIFLASSLFTPTPPALPVLPVDFRRIKRSFDQTLYFGELRRLGFQSRAPPARLKAIA